MLRVLLPFAVLTLYPRADPVSACGAVLSKGSRFLFKAYAHFGDAVIDMAAVCSTPISLDWGLSQLGFGVPLGRRDTGGEDLKCTEAPT